MVKFALQGLASLKATTTWTLSEECQRHPRGHSES